MTTTTTSATSTPTSGHRTVPSPGSGTDVLRSWRAEASRLARWPAVWTTVGAWLVLSTLFAYVFPYLSYRNGGGGFGPQEQATTTSLLAQVVPAAVPEALLQGTPMFGGALMMVLGAIVAGNGYGWGTVKTVLTQGPSRTATVIGSLFALATVVVGTVVASLLLDLGLSTVLALVEGAATDLPSVGALAESVGTALLVLGTWAAAGFALGTVARGPALSVGLGLVWALVLENLLRGTGALLGAVESFTHVLPGTATGSLVGAVIGTDGTPGVLDVLDGPRALATTIAYLVVLPVLTVLLVRRRDVA